MNLDVVTWNLMGLNEDALDERTEASCLELLLHDPPDIVLLQEVVERSLFAHLRPHFSAAGFVLAPSEPVSDSSYFCAVALRGRAPVSAWRRPFVGTGMGRALLALEAEGDGGRLLVCTAHLESGTGAKRQRGEQTQQVVDALTSHDGPALFGGDTNLRGDGNEWLAPAGVVDAWAAAGSPKASRDTWWPLRGKGPRLRFDRLWLGGTGTWTVRSLRTGGDRRVNGYRLSDHLWLRAALQWSPGS